MAESGVLNVIKPQGITSHDVVSRVRRLVHQKRVGHAGTLDPMATGVLLVCIGKATRLAEYLSEGEKTYIADIRFGVTTDTWDADGATVHVADASALDLETVESALTHFLGNIQQVPPMYSALKREGRPLYQLARQGIEVPRDARAVVIRELTVLHWEPPILRVRIRCSKGTYVRSLAHDLGQSVGAGAHLVGLTRTAVGPFEITGAVDLHTLEQEGSQGRWMQFLIPMRAAMAGMPAVMIDAETAQRIRMGQAVTLTQQGEHPWNGPPCDVTDLCAACLDDREVLAILRYDPEGGLWRPLKVFDAL
ncbi:MAG: tRNA pseudouridine(55) synthase TruB [Anaerolineae bacterium]